MTTWFISPARSVRVHLRPNCYIAVAVPQTLSATAPPPFLVPYEGKGSPYSISERRVPELILVLGRQPEVT